MFWKSLFSYEGMQVNWVSLTPGQKPRFSHGNPVQFKKDEREMWQKQDHSIPAIVIVWMTVAFLFSLRHRAVHVRCKKIKITRNKFHYLEILYSVYIKVIVISIKHVWDWIFFQVFTSLQVWTKRSLFGLRCIKRILRFPKKSRKVFNHIF